MHELKGVTKGLQIQALSASTIAFAVCFAVWTIFSIIGLRIKEELGLSETEFGILVATPILTGSVTRIFLGILSDQFGGKIVYTLLMVFAAIATWLLSTVTSYAMFLVAALGLGFAGGSFAVGVAYVSRWFEKERQGTALGIFGVGNLGAAATNFGAPFLLLALGWEKTAQVYALILFATAVVFFLFTKEDPATAKRKAEKGRVEPLKARLKPLQRLQVWRFSLYYFFVFGGFVALSLWLPRYYVGAYGLDIKTAGILAAAYSLPTSLFRGVGGWLSDKWGARRVMYITFIASVAICFILSYPATTYTVEGIRGPIEFRMAIGQWPFTFLVFILGLFMAMGMAAVYKHVPVYYPKNVGTVGGLVGTIGGLGGFFLPIAFGFMNDVTGVWTSCFMLMFAVVAAALTWMHFAIRRMERAKVPQLDTLPQLPEMAELHGNHIPRV